MSNAATLDPEHAERAQAASERAMRDHLAPLAARSCDPSCGCRCDRSTCACFDSRRPSPWPTSLMDECLDSPERLDDFLASLAKLNEGAA